MNVCQARWVRFAKTVFQRMNSSSEEVRYERLSSALGSFRKNGISEDELFK